MKRFTVSHMRQMLSTEEMVLRSTMPVISKADSTPLTRRDDAPTVVVLPLTITLSEAVRS
jgi:hypothetical protein